MTHTPGPWQRAFGTTVLGADSMKRTLEVLAQYRAEFARLQTQNSAMLEALRALVNSRPSHGVIPASFPLAIESARAIVNQIEEEIEADYQLRKRAPA